MKKIIILFAVITFSVTKIIAQTVWAPIGAKWSNEFYCPFSGKFGLETFKSVKDTLILNKTCRKIECSYYFENRYIGTKITSNYYYLMYSENDKVFYFYNNSFYLLYDFSLNAGDTLVIPQQYPFGYQDSIITRYLIKSVDSVVISGKKLKRQEVNLIIDSSVFFKYYLHYFDNLYGENFIIEYIGSIAHMFGSDWYPSEDCWDKNLKCYSDNEISYKKRPQVNCDWFSEINENINNNEVTIFPNPATVKINIDYSIRQNLKMQLFNAFGQCILQKEFNSQTNTIDISSLTRGIYILKITTPNGTIEKKIIKE